MVEWMRALILIVQKRFALKPNVWGVNGCTFMLCLRCGVDALCFPRGRKGIPKFGSRMAYPFSYGTDFFIWLEELHYPCDMMEIVYGFHKTVPPLPPCRYMIWMQKFQTVNCTNVVEDVKLLQSNGRNGVRRLQRCVSLGTSQKCSSGSAKKALFAKGVRSWLHSSYPIYIA